MARLTEFPLSHGSRHKLAGLKRGGGSGMFLPHSQFQDYFTGGDREKPGNRERKTVVMETFPFK